MYGTLVYESTDTNGRIKLSFVPSDLGIEERGMAPVTMSVFSPFEIIDLVYFEYIEKKRK